MSKAENLIRQTLSINKQIADQRSTNRRNKNLSIQVQDFGMPSNRWTGKSPVADQDQDDSFIRFEEAEIATGD